MNCEKCDKPESLCVCASITPVITQLEAPTQILILQHPQEPDRMLGTGRLSTLVFPQAQLRIGLSWRNLAHALGNDKIDPKKWAVLYLGSVKVETFPVTSGPLFVVDKKGILKPGALPEVEGIILLDGTWSQAKALWWRNAWLLKLHRFVLNPQAPSLYGHLRKEPRRESISTLESLALTLATLANDPSVFTRAIAPFQEMLKKARALPRSQLSVKTGAKKKHRSRRTR